MSRVTSPHWTRLERWSSSAFLAAGGLLTVYAALNGLAAFTDTAYLMLEDVVGPGGFVFGFIGLLGLYPALSDRCPRLARAAALFVTLGAVGFSAITVSNIGELVGIGSGSSAAWFPVAMGMVIVGMALGYLSFGVTSLRAGVHPRLVGLLLLLPSLVFTVMAIGGATGIATATGAFLISSAQAVIHLSIWRMLPEGVTAGVPTSGSADVTTG